MAKKDKKASTEVAGVSPVSNDDWKAEDDARTIMRAAEIMADEARLGLARKHLKKQKKAFRCVDDLIAYRDSGGSESED